MLAPILALTISLLAAHDPATNAPLVPNAEPTEELGRYTSPRTYEATLKFYQRYFQSKGGVRWNKIINNPIVKARNITSLRSSTKWEGINVYKEKGNVRIFVIPR